MDYYYFSMSSHCRGPWLTAEALGIKMNMKPIDFFKDEHMRPEFIAINPEHTVPTLVDGDYILWERSVSIIKFLERTIE